MVNYYELYDYVSNSDLGEVNDEVRGKEKPENIQDIYDFGSLFDAMLTEPDKVDLENRILRDGGRSIQFSEESIEKAINMKIAADSDSFLSSMIKMSKFQHIILRKKHEFSVPGVSVFMPARCKYDLLVKSMKLGGDIKTTSCKTRDQFINAILQFNYDRQGAFYMDLGNLDRFVFIGISKHKNKFGKHDVFKFVIERGDEFYDRGKMKYCYLGFKYYHLLYKLSQFQ